MTRRGNAHRPYTVFAQETRYGDPRNYGIVVEDLVAHGSGEALRRARADFDIPHSVRLGVVPTMFFFEHPERRFNAARRRFGAAISLGTNPPGRPLTPKEQKVYDALTNEPKIMRDLKAEIGLHRSNGGIYGCMQTLISRGLAAEAETTYEATSFGHSIMRKARGYIRTDKDPTTPPGLFESTEPDDV